MARQNNIPGQEKKLTIEQKTGFLFLLIFGMITISLGFLQLRNTIYNPFVIRATENKGNQQIVLDENIRLQQIDTDLDGINDYDEINYHETSPYIPDTDSDGIDDGVEIENGEDPLCPRGEICGTTPIDNETDQGISASDNIPPPPELPTGINIDQNTQIENNQQVAFDIESIIDNPDALRQLLLESGSLTAEQLEKIDNKTLLDLARQLVEDSKNAQEDQ